MEETASDQFGDRASVLVLSPSLDIGPHNPCLDFVDAPDRALVVSYVRSPDEWVANWRAVRGTLPDELVVLAPGDWPGTGLPPGVSVESIASPGDLTGQGIRVNEYLDRWAGTDVVICFDSLTTLLPYGELNQVYRFVHLLSTRLEGTGVRVLFGLDPAAVDDQTVATLTSAVRVVARRDGDEWTIQTR